MLSVRSKLKVGWGDEDPDDKPVCFNDASSSTSCDWSVYNCVFSWIN